MLQNPSKRLMRDFCYGTQMPYNYTPETEIPPPEGYVPFYINYLGRHGGRVLSNQAEAEWICTILECAYEHQGLTLRGLELLSKLLHILELRYQPEEEMNLNGKKAIEEIAHRMCINYPECLGRRINATASGKERAIISRDLFVKELQRYSGTGKIQIHTNGNIDPVLRFYDWNRQYSEYKERGDWKQVLSTFEARSNMADRVLERIFRREFFRNNCLTTKEKSRFVSGLFQIYTNQIDTNGVISLSYYFTAQEKYYFWENLNLKQYLLMGPGLLGSGSEGKYAFPILMDFLRTSEQAVMKGDTSIDIRFAHAETMIPFYTLLKIPGMCEQAENVYKVSAVWKNYLIAPIAANLQWIFYKIPGRIPTDNNGVLVKIKWNEVVVKLPITTDVYPYYHWGQIKEYYEDQLRKLKIPKGKRLADVVREYRF